MITQPAGRGEPAELVEDAPALDVDAVLEDFHARDRVVGRGLAGPVELRGLEEAARRRGRASRAAALLELRGIDVRADARRRTVRASAR